MNKVIKNKKRKYKTFNKNETKLKKNIISILICLVKSNLRRLFRTD